jgi:hypothetical protein
LEATGVNGADDRPRRELLRGETLSSSRIGSRVIAAFDELATSPNAGDLTKGSAT